MTKEEAIEVYNGLINLKIKEAFEFFAPELKESEDERIRKIIRLALIASEDELTNFYKVHNTCRKECTDWLEKQKEPHYTKRNALFDKCVANCDPEIMKKVSDEIDSQLKKEQKQSQVADASKMEQPEVDFEKEIDKAIADYSFTKTIDSGGFKTTVIDYAKIARHFYELGLNARKEE